MSNHLASGTIKFVTTNHSIWSKIYHDTDASDYRVRSTISVEKALLTGLRSVRDRGVNHSGLVLGIIFYRPAGHFGKVSAGAEVRPSGQR